MEFYEVTTNCPSGYEVSHRTFHLTKKGATAEAAHRQMEVVGHDTDCPDVVLIGSIWLRA